ncbi:MAG: signal peptidase I [Clostridia bacterium]|nr:signal peptidase I [Clostridia bacterium]
MKAGSKHLKKNAKLQAQWLRSTGLIIVVVLLATSLLLNLFQMVFPVVKYYGTGMEPSLKDGQILIVNKLAKIKKGDIVAFYFNNKVLVRRVIAAEGDEVSIDMFGAVSVNGKVLEEPYASEKTLGQCNLKFPYTVPAHHYFVLGDQRQVAMDSRLKEIGSVDRDRMIGKVFFTLN